MGILSTLIGPATELAGKFIQDKDQAAQLAHDLSTMADKHAQEALLAQIEVNKTEAQGNWFQASWRPLCGYVCVLDALSTHKWQLVYRAFSHTLTNPHPTQESRDLVDGFAST